MSYKEVQDLSCEITISLGGRNRETGKDNPKSIEGYFRGSKNTPNKKSKSGISKLHIFQTPKGNVGVWGKTDLDRKLLAVPLGNMTRATQTGMISTPNGEMYTYKVEFDPDNTIEVSSFVGSDESSTPALDEEQETSSFTSSKPSWKSGSTASFSSSEESTGSSEAHKLLAGRTKTFTR